MKGQQMIQLQGQGRIKCIDFLKYLLLLICLLYVHGSDHKRVWNIFQNGWLFGLVIF